MINHGLVQSTIKPKETEIDEYKDFNYIIKNKSLQDLKNSVLEIVHNEECLKDEEE